MIRVTGLDPSLNSAGGASFSAGGASAVYRWKPSAKWRGEQRMEWLVGQAVDLAEGSDLVVIENVIGSRVLNVAAHLELAGLHWAIRLRLHAMGIPVAVVQPSLRMKYLVGAGKAEKSACLMIASKRWPDIDFTCDDEADAYTLAHMGADWLGLDGVTRMPATHRAVLTAVVSASKAKNKPAHPAIDWPKLNGEAHAGIA